MHRGLVHFYYGDGKGKTTAALGLALRAAGSEKDVVIVQFLKDWKCGELQSLALLPNVRVLRGKSSGGTFVHEMSDEEKSQTKIIHDKNLKTALEFQKKGQCDLLVLDEVVDAYNLGVLDATLFEGLLDNKPEALEIVITGHEPNVRVLERADYVTEMLKVRHPFDEGASARRGIEF
ncbi:MAG: cob(I)yrinic acid a,c-diamide adenosyltransferase [Ignavibacteriales bacterium]